MILYIFSVHVLIFTHFYLFLFFLTFYNVNIFSDHWFIPANLLIFLIGLFSLNKDININNNNNNNNIIIIIIIIIIIKGCVVPKTPNRENLRNCFAKPQV